MNSVDYNKRLLSVGLLLLRVFLGVAMISHGFPKLQELISAENVDFVSFLGLSPKISLALAVFSEFVCSIFLILGLFTRAVLVPLIITILFAIFGVLLGSGFGKMELALHYLFGYILLIISGPGIFSIDGMIKRSSRSRW